MGYSRFSGNEEDIMRVILREPKVDKSELVEGYPDDIKSLQRKKMILCKKVCSLTDRGKSAITQQLRSGEYWVAPLKPKKFELFGKARISKEMAGYIK